MQNLEYDGRSRGSRLTGLVSSSLVLATLSASFVGVAPPQLGPAIVSTPLVCMATTEFSVVDALITPSDQIRTGRIYFRSDSYPDYYFVELTRIGDHFQAVLPKPNFETQRVIFYFEAVDVSFNITTTPESEAEVVEDADSCRRRDPKAAFYTGQNPSIIVGATSAAAPALPPGFAIEGIAQVISVAGATGGIGAGTLTLAAAGAAVAAGLGVGLLESGETTTTTEPGGPIPPTGGPGSITTTSTTTTTISVVVVNNPPEACFETRPTPPVIMEGEQITLDGRCSTPSGDLAYEWDLGDGRSRSGSFIEPTYNTPGSYNVTLTVNKLSAPNQRDSTSRTIRVESAPDIPEPPEPTPPVLQACFTTSPDPPLIREGESITLDGQCSSPAGRITTYAWVLGDGRTDVGAVVRPVYTQAGTYGVSLTVGDGIQTNSTRKDVRVLPIEADLAVALMAGSPSPIVEFRVLITVVNNGPSGANDVTLKYQFEAPYSPCTPQSPVCYSADLSPSFARCSGGGPFNCFPPGIGLGDPVPIRCEASELPSGSSFDVTVTHRYRLESQCPGQGLPPPSGSFVMLAEVSSSTPDKNSGNNAVAAKTTIGSPVSQSQRDRQETSFLSELRILRRDGDARARLILNDARSDNTDNTAPYRHQVRGKLGENTVEGYLVSEASGEGQWEFQFSGADHFVPGSLKVDFGELISLDAYRVVFRLSGAPGERMKFRFELR